jgi:hypothetical protein
MLSQSRTVIGYPYTAPFERRRDRRLQTVRIRLIRKLANYLDGIDLSAYQVGDVLDLPRREADLLIREGWAVPAPEPSNREQIQRCDNAIDFHWLEA